MLRYAITDRTQYAETEQDRRAGLIDQARRLAKEGFGFIQLRERDLPAEDLIGIAREILSEIREARSRTKLLINARADIALAAGADGVHLPSGEDQMTPGQIRELFEGVGARRPSISASCHTLAEIERAKKSGADVVLFGPVFGKWVGSEVVVLGTGIKALEAACERAGEMPVLALGGVTAGNSAQCIAAGAKGVAAIRLFR